MKVIKMNNKKNELRNIDIIDWFIVTEGEIKSFDAEFEELKASITKTNSAHDVLQNSISAFVGTIMTISLVAIVGNMTRFMMLAIVMSCMLLNIAMQFVLYSVRKRIEVKRTKSLDSYVNDLATRYPKNVQER